MFCICFRVEIKLFVSETSFVYWYDALLDSDRQTDENPASFLKVL